MSALHESMAEEEDSGHRKEGPRADGGARLAATRRPRLLRLFAPELQDPRRSARALALWRIAVVFACVGISILAVTPWLPGTAVTVIASLLGIACWVGTLVLVRSGKLDAAAWLLVIGQWAQPTAVSLMHGGMPSAVSTSFLLAALMAGMLFDFRSAAWILGLIAATVVGFVYLQAIGVMSTTMAANTGMVGPTLLINLLGVVVVIVSSHEYRQFEHELSLRYEAELRHAQKMEAIGRLAGGIAHDFNNSLTAILGYGEILRERTRGDARAHSAANQVFGAAQSAAELTSRLLTFSRRSAESPTPTRLGERIRQIEPMLSRLLEAGIDIELDLAEDLPPISVPGSTIEQIVVNLALNASDAMRSQGRLRIEAARDAGPDGMEQVLLRVSDDGVGMTADVLARAFDPFFTTKQDRGGTGLGLSSVYGLVQSCGGAIGIESEPERGTCVELRFPAAPENAAPSTGAPLRDAKKSPRKRALIAEDDPRVRALIADVLEAAGHEVIVGSDGEEAETLAARAPGPIDLLVSDVIMPRVDGLELVKRLAPSHPAMRVLLVSGYTGSDARPLPREASFLAKPFSPRDLERKIGEMFGGRAGLGGDGNDAPAADPRPAENRASATDPRPTESSES